MDSESELMEIISKTQYTLVQMLVKVQDAREIAESKVVEYEKKENKRILKEIKEMYEEKLEENQRMYEEKMAEKQNKSAKIIEDDNSSEDDNSNDSQERDYSAYFDLCGDWLYYNNHKWLTLSFLSLYLYIV